jgi:hypothetical protein
MKNERKEKLLPKEYKWECQGEKLGKKKGRTAWGVITGVKMEIKEKRQEKEEEGCMERKKIMTIYSKKMKTTVRGVEDTMKENRQECMLIGGDFNGRIGSRGARK